MSDSNQKIKTESADEDKKVEDPSDGLGDGLTPPNPSTTDSDVIITHPSPSENTSLSPALKQEENGKPTTMEDLKKDLEAQQKVAVDAQIQINDITHQATIQTVSVSSKLLLETQLCRQQALQSIHSRLLTQKPELISAEELNFERETIDMEFDRFTEHHTQLCSLLPDQHPYFSSLQYRATMNTVIEARRLVAKLLSLKRPVNTSGSGSAPPPSSRGNQLKRLDIKEFSGNYSDWKEFSNIFKSLVIDNSSYDAVMKLALLKEKLENVKAKGLLTNFDLTSQNFTRAWENSPTGTRIHI